MIPMELKLRSVCYFHINLYLIPKIEENAMFEDLKEMVPKIAILSDQDTSKIRLLKQNL